MFSRIRFVVMMTFLLVCAAPGYGSLIGTSVTGSLIFLGHPPNYFDPTNGFVPATGYENSAGTTVTISSSAIEFGAVFPANTDSADFTATQLIIKDTVDSAGTNTPFVMSFTDAALAGLSVSKVSDTFVNGGTTAALSGNVLTATWNGGPVDVGTLEAVYDVTSIPEPFSWALLLMGMACLTAWRLVTRRLHARL